MGWIPEKMTLGRGDAFGCANEGDAGSLWDVCEVETIGRADEVAKGRIPERAAVATALRIELDMVVDRL